MAEKNPWPRWRRWAAVLGCRRASGLANGARMRISRASARPGSLVAPFIALVPVCVMLIGSALHATDNTITVNNTTDPASTSGNGFCTLREAIHNANAESDTTGGDCARGGTGNDTIVFSVSGTIPLGSSLPAIQNNLTIDGSGQ